VTYAPSYPVAPSYAPTPSYAPAPSYPQQSYAPAPTYPVQPAAYPCNCPAPMQQTYAPQQDIQTQKMPLGQQRSASYASAELQKQ
jgi:hypothetical protein